MKFGFDVAISDKDFLDYNDFIMRKSHYGRSGFRSMRIIIAVIVILIAVISLMGGGFSAETFIGVIPCALLIAVLEAALAPFMRYSVKQKLKGMKKNGNVPYSTASRMEFYDDRFVEITDASRQETLYTAVDRISVVGNKVIYIHLNEIMAYIVPFSSFGTWTEGDEFVAFLRTKCEKVDVYGK